MTAFDYAAVAARALATLQKFGQAVTLQRAGAATYDTTSGQNAQTPSPNSGTGVIFDYTPGEMQKAGGLIRVGDKRMYLAATDPPPKTNDVVVDAASVKYTVIACDTLAPAGVTVLHDVQLRK